MHQLLFAVCRQCHGALCFYRNPTKNVTSHTIHPNYATWVIYKITISLLYTQNIIDIIVNCTYVGINVIHRMLDLPRVKLKIQDVIIPIFKYNHDRIGITIMDGEYCSFLPKGINKNTFLLYNVKYSVAKHTYGYFYPTTWTDVDADKVVSNIYDDSMKYYPFLQNVERI